MKTQLRTADGWSYIVRRDGRIVAQASKKPTRVLWVLDTKDLDYALLFGRKRWPHLAHCLEAVLIP